MVTLVGVKLEAEAPPIESPMSWSPFQRSTVVRDRFYHPTEQSENEARCGCTLAVEKHFKYLLTLFLCRQVCGYRQKYLRESGTHIGGICLSRRDTNQNVSFIKSKYHGGESSVLTWDPDKRENRGVYLNRFVEWGISVRLSTVS